VRADSFFLGFAVGVASVFAGIGLVQLLITKGYSIAVNLVEAGWSARELRAHRKQAIVLQWIEKARAEGNSQR
jgi:hypothetical protein